MDSFRTTGEANSKRHFGLLADGLGFTEGPTFMRSGQLVVTSMDRGHIYSISASTVALLAAVGGGANGATEAADGSIMIAQNGGRGPGHRNPSTVGGVQRIAPDGRVTWVTMDPIAPSDLCFGPDRLLYVTDPTRAPIRNDGRLWRVDTASGEAELLASVAWYPNGIAFGREDDAFYVASTWQSAIVRFPLRFSGVGDPEVFAITTGGAPDGIAFDAEGNLIAALIGTEPSKPGCLQIFDENGRLLDTVELGSSHYYTNVALSAQHTLVVTDASAGAVLTTSAWPTAGLPLHPFRYTGKPAR
jgi:gluconolactonase